MAHPFLLLLLRTISAVPVLVMLSLLVLMPSPASPQVADGLVHRQKFAMEPQDQTAVVGSKVTLPCRVIDKVGILQWTKDDFGLGTHRNLSGYDRYSMIGSDEEGDFSLEIFPVMLDDDARYQCQVSAAQGQPMIRSHFANLKVYVPPEPPRILQGSYLLATEDRRIELDCESVGGRPPAEITWIDGLGNVHTEDDKDGLVSVFREELPDKRRTTVRSTLQVTPRKEHHNTTFTCEAQNHALETHLSAKITVEVKYAPKVRVSIISGAGESGRIAEGSDVHLDCHADANPPDVTYRWFLNDEPIIGDYTTELVLVNVTRKHHDAIVKCEVHNAVGKSEESETLDVSYGPQFRVRPLSVQAEPHSKVILSCDVDGNPYPEIGWFRETDGRKIGSGPNLTLRADHEATGRYYCEAAVTGYRPIRAEAAVYLRGPPSIVSHRTQFGVEGGNVRVECTAFSVPAPDRVVWAFNGKEVDARQDLDYSILEDPLPEGIKSTLVIHESQRRHFGSYNCSVSNPYGSDMVEISLLPQKKFPTLIIIVGVIAAIIVLIIVIMVIFMCQKQTKKPPPENDTNTMEKQCKESDRSSNISELKLDLRAGSSNSNLAGLGGEYGGGQRGGSETGSESAVTRIGVPLAGPVPIHLQPDHHQGLYSSSRYSGEYNEPTFPPKDGHNNNGYVPYVDYSREYTPPPLMQPPIMSSSLEREALQSTRLHLPSVTASAHLPLSDLVPNGGAGLVDPRYNAAYGNPYLAAGTPPNTANPSATPAPPPYTRLGTPPNGNIPQVTRLPTSPTSQYILPTAAARRGTMATHV